jgi:midasin (ATPase involved in ribosome maturation)
MTDFSYKKIFSAKIGGGRRDHAVALALDASASMRGSVGQQQLDTLFLIANTLQNMDVEQFTIVLFDKDVHVLKTSQQPWDLKMKWLVEHQYQALQAMSIAESNDADGILVSLKLLSDISASAKHLFVVSSPMIHYSCPHSSCNV